jgi:hypothetical protein
MPNHADNLRCDLLAQKAAREQIGSRGTTVRTDGISLEAEEWVAAQANEGDQLARIRCAHATCRPRPFGLMAHDGAVQPPVSNRRRCPSAFLKGVRLQWKSPPVRQRAVIEMSGT